MSRTPADEGALRPSEEYLDAWQRLAKMIQQGRSFSGHERNCAFLNTAGGRFADVSAVTGLDHDDDGRALAYTDWDEDGDLDIWLTSRTGPRVRYLRNDIASGNGFLAIRLAGDPARKTNRDAIGARVEVVLSAGTPGRRVKTLYGGHGFLSQSSKWLHFGLGKGAAIERVVVRWPGMGGIEEFRGLLPGKRYRLVQGSGKGQEIPSSVHPGLAPSRPSELPSGDDARIRVAAGGEGDARDLKYTGLDGKEQSLDFGGPLLVNLWATWCAPCLSELKSFAESDAEIRKSGLTILALNVDGLGSAGPIDPAQVERVTERLGFRSPVGIPSAQAVEKLEALDRGVIYRQRQLPLPTSFLFGRGGRLAAIYKGRVDVKDLLADTASLERLEGDPKPWRDWAVPFAGRWCSEIFVTNPIAIAQVYLEGGYRDDAKEYLDRYLKKEEEPPAAGARLDDGTKSLRLADVHHWLGRIARMEGKLPEAIAAYREALRLNPMLREAHVDLGAALVDVGESARAKEHLSRALELKRGDPAALTRLADALLSEGRTAEAISLYREALQVAPNYSLAANNLAWIRATHPDAEHRDGNEAVRLAMHACESSAFRQPAPLDTLAAAYAEAGRFGEAIATARRAADLARSQGLYGLASEIAARQARYEAHQPFRSAARAVR